MSEGLPDTIAASQKAPLPKWVVDYVIAVSEYARIRGLTDFESKINQATEVLLDELDRKGLLVQRPKYSVVSTSDKLVLIGQKARSATKRRYAIAPSGIEAHR